MTHSPPEESEPKRARIDVAEVEGWDLIAAQSPSFLKLEEAYAYFDGEGMEGVKHYDLNAELDAGLRLLAKVGVLAHNRRKGKHLELVKPLKANRYEPEPFYEIYYITLLARDKGTDVVKEYQARVLYDYDDVHAFRPKPNSTGSAPLLADQSNYQWMQNYS